MVLEYLQVQSKACASLCFSASLPWIGYLSLWMHQGLSPPWFITSHGISPTHNMKSRLVIKFPPSRARKGVKCPGYARGGGCLSFDLTDTLQTSFWLELIFVQLRDSKTTAHSSELNHLRFFYKTKLSSSSSSSRTGETGNREKTAIQTCLILSRRSICYPF